MAKDALKYSITKFESDYMGIILNIFNNGWLSEDTARKEVANQIIPVDLSKDPAVIRSFAIDYEQEIARIISNKEAFAKILRDPSANFVAGEYFCTNVTGEELNGSGVIDYVDALRYLPQRIFLYSVLTRMAAATTGKVPGKMTFVIGKAYVQKRDKKILEQYMAQHKKLVCAAYAEDKDIVSAQANSKPANPMQYIATQSSQEIMSELKNVTEAELAVAKSKPSVWVHDKKKRIEDYLHGDIKLINYIALDPLKGPDIVEQAAEHQAEMAEKREET